MHETIGFAKYFSVFLASMFKFFIGPLTGYAVGLYFWETLLLTITGMMSSVLVFTFLGKGFKKQIMDRYFKKKKLFTKWNRRIVTIWIKFGLTGIAFFTPLFLTPIGGAIIANSFQQDWKKIFIYMLVSAVIWGIVLTALVYFLGNLGYDQFLKH